MKATSRSLTALLVMLCAGVLAAQQPVFRSSTDFVRLDVVVTDGDDRPIGGLPANVFKEIDGGRPQTVTDFDWIHSEKIAAPVRVVSFRRMQPPRPRSCFSRGSGGALAPAPGRA